MNQFPMPQDGGSYRREPDGSLTRLDAPQTFGEIEPIEHLDDAALLDLEECEHDGSDTALPPIESQPRRSRRNQE
jgi:hypothetical protein